MSDKEIAERLMRLVERRSVENIRSIQRPVSWRQKAKRRFTVRGSDQAGFVRFLK